MILVPGPNAAGTPTLDALVREHARRTPDRLAMIDAPDRPLWSDGAPRRLSWAGLDAAVDSIARRLGELGLSADTPVAIQGPNATDTLLAILAALRAALTPVLLPADWRRREIAAAVERTGVRAILTVTRAGPVLPADQLRYVAAEAFGIRFVCSFGAEVPDGVISLEECVAGAEPGFEAPARGGEPADHLALVTWDCSPAGFLPVARSHAEVLASAVSALTPDSVLLSSFSPCGLAAWATALAPWLVAGASLVLHQGFDATVLGVQIERHAVTHLVLPDVVADAVLAEQPPFGLDLLRVVRRPDLAGVPAERNELQLRTVVALGEMAVLTPQAGDDGALRLAADPGPVESRLDINGLLELRGLMVPRAGFGTRQRPPYPVDDEGWAATNVPAILEGGRLTITGPRADMVSVGGHALALADVDELYAEVAGARAVNAVALPCPVLGQRLGLSAMPDPESTLSASALVLHAEDAGASPLAMSADVELGDRRAAAQEAARLAGAA